MRIMLDTNIFISGMVFKGRKRRLLDVICIRRYILVFNDYILEEICTVLRRKFPGKELILDSLLKLLQIERTPLLPANKVEEAKKIIRDPKDAVILASLMYAKPDIFVSGDLDFHTLEIAAVAKVMTTKEALELLKRNEF